MANENTQTSDRVFEAEGKHFVDVNNGDDTLGPFRTNAEAWRALEKINDEPHNAAESRWAWSQDQQQKENPR